MGSNVPLLNEAEQILAGLPRDVISESIELDLRAKEADLSSATGCCLLMPLIRGVGGVLLTEGEY